ncbi:MAG: lipopolysaccharide biosynthesis protein [Flavobacteriales bacterium]|nr:lipopolysaccharide biosynthesis protein [Flavobacteriales bacterium]
MRSLKMRGSFVQNSAYMFSGSGLAILIQFIFFPILTRIYDDPDVYGLFGVFNFYAVTVGGLATAGYSFAFSLPREEAKFTALLKLTVYITCAVCLFFFLLSIVAGNTIMRWMNTEVLGWWIYLIGPVGFLVAFDRILMDWSVRQKTFGQSTVWSTVNSVFNKSFNLCYGKFISPTTDGLLITFVLNYTVQPVLYLAFVVRNSITTLRTKVSLSALKQTAKEYKEFPLYIFWGNNLNLISANIPSVLLPATGFGLGAVGYYNFAVLVLELPIRLLGSGVSSVFMAKAIEMKDERPEELKHATWRVFKNMVAISLLCTVVLFVAGRPLYELFFGKAWGDAGRVVELLAVYYFFRLVSAPLAVLYIAFRKEKEFFIFQMFVFTGRILSLVMGAWYTSDLFELMTIFSIVNGAMYLFFCARIFALAGISVSKGMAFTLFWGVSLFGLAYLLKWFLLS